jgi:Zn-dependent M32 family carboxypeptidase
MHFRTRNRVIQVIRTSYDPATKKPKAQLLGTVNKANPEISDELRLTCKPKELLELKAYLQNQHQLSRMELEMAARTLVIQMQKAAEWFDTAMVNTENEVLAADINRQFPMLRKKLQRLLKAADDAATTVRTRNAGD